MELSDALYELERSKKKCKGLSNEWDDIKRLAEEKNIESNYQEILYFILDNGEMQERHERKRDGVIYIDEDDCDGENDAQHDLFLSKRKEHGNSVDASEQESRQKMMTCAKQIISLSNQKPNLLNNQAAVVQHQSDMQAHSGNSSSMQCARLLMNLVVGENVRRKESELLSHNSCTRINCLPGNECDPDGDSQPVQKNKVQSQIKSEGHLYQKAGRGNQVIEKLCDPVYPAQPGERVKAGNQRKLKEVIQIDDEKPYSMLGRRNIKLVKNQSEHARLAGSGDNSNFQNPRKKFKVVKGTNLVKKEKVPDRIDVIQIDNARLYKKAGPGKDKGKNVVGEDGGANRRAVFRVVKEHVHPQAGQKNNRLKQYENEHVYRARPVKEFKEQIHRKLKGKNVAKGDLVIIHIDDENSSVDPGPRNDILVKEGNDESAPEVEILDSAAFMKPGILSPFVPSKRFHKSMMDDDESQHLGRPSASDEFRKEVLKVLRKPFDKEEYKRHQKAIQAGSYRDHYKDLGRKLKIYRYRKEKCLTIFRGFFFWLQNLTREGAFQPWKDRQCLAVEI